MPGLENIIFLLEHMMMIYIIDIFVPTLDYAHYTRIIHSTLCSNLTYFMTAVVWSKRWTVRSLLACY